MVPMNQDVFIEKIVPRKKKPLDYLIFVLVIFGSILLIFIALNFLPPEIFMSIGPILVAGVIYLAYRVVGSQNAEFEYIATNDDITIDKIISRKRRKRIFTGSCKNFTVIAPITNRAFETNQRANVKVIDCSTDITSKNNWFFVTKKDSEQVLIVFEPDDRYIQVFRRHNPRVMQT